jgi:CHAT domain-containing protein
MAFLVPLDALPMGPGRTGDRFRIVYQSSFGSLVSPRPEPEDAPTLLLLGSPDFDAHEESPDLAAATSAPVESDRGDLPEHFAPLEHTGPELEALAALFARTFEREALVLRAGEASKAAFSLHAAGARFLHLATHGWFAPESVRSVLDETPGAREGWDGISVEETVAGFAPMTLCGLALSGANHGRDSLGRVSGIMTAEELSSLDLSRCELAVLSACETNVGISRAGQGIQSLQAALHAAGARTAVTSLWKVPDAATRELMERFYTYLWVEKLPTAEALWKAKCDLRAGGRPVRDWAGWVLSGGPGN